MDKYSSKSNSIFGLFIVLVMLIIMGVLISRLGEMIHTYHLIITYGSLVFIGGIVVYRIQKLYRRKKIIDSLRTRGDYKRAVLIRLEEKHRRGRHPSTHYVYICRDTDTGKIYKSDEISNIGDCIFNIGGITRLYISSEFPKIYWIDLSNTESGSGKTLLSLEELQQGEAMMNKIKKIGNEKNRNILLLLGMITGMVACTISASLAPSYLTLKNGVETIGTITKIEPHNTKCKGSKHYYPCTVYYMTISLDEFESKSYSRYGNINIKYAPMPTISMHPTYIDTHGLKLAGHDRSISESRYQIGQKVELIVDKYLVNEDLIYDGIEIKEVFLEENIKLGIFVGILFIISILLMVFWKIGHRPRGSSQSMEQEKNGLI